MTIYGEEVRGADKAMPLPNRRYIQRGLASVPQRDWTRAAHNGDLSIKRYTRYSEYSVQSRCCPHGCWIVLGDPLHRSAWTVGREPYFQCDLREKLPAICTKGSNTSSLPETIPNSDRLTGRTTPPEGSRRQQKMVGVATPDVGEEPLGDMASVTERSPMGQVIPFPLPSP